MIGEEALSKVVRTQRIGIIQIYFKLSPMLSPQN